jgi:DNA-binding response OmpR family regulator
MPDMDGVAAAKAIRALAPPTNAIPIIALTANALAGQREEYLTAGMSDYLSKPVRPEALVEALARWGAAAAATPAPATPASVAAPQSPVLAEDSMLASLAASLPDNELRTIVTSFLADAKARQGRIAALAQQRDLPMLAREAHDLAGTAGNVGAVHLAELARELQQRCKSNDIDDLAALVDALALATDTAAAVLRSRYLAAVA